MKSIARATVALLAAAALTASSTGSAVPSKPDDKTILHVLTRISDLVVVLSSAEQASRLDFPGA